MMMILRTMTLMIINLIFETDMQLAKTDDDDDELDEYGLDDHHVIAR